MTAIYIWGEESQWGGELVVIEHTQACTLLNKSYTSFI